MAATTRTQICLLVNPVAGGGRAGRRLQAVVTALRGHGLEVRTVSVDGIESVSATAASAAATGETVVVLGGDGMARAAAAGLGRLPGSVMGIIPAGRGNDLARVLEIPTDPAAACAVIADGVPRAMDLGEVNGRQFVGIASVGFDSDANHIANLAPSWMGSGVYAYGAARALMHWRPATFALELLPSRERIQFTGYSVAFANSRCFGGGMRLAPGALLDDGQLDVILIKQMARARYAWHLPKVFRGRHVGLDVVGMHRSTEAVLSADRPFTIYADGDPIGELPARIRTVPRAIAVLTDPAASPAFSAPEGATAALHASPASSDSRASVIGAPAVGAPAVGAPVSGATVGGATAGGATTDGAAAAQAGAGLSGPHLPA